MRKIEQSMLQALAGNTYWKESNTMVHGTTGDVYLHGNHIAKLFNGVLSVNRYTLARWPSATTKSRLRALGANVTTKNGVTYLDNEKV